MCLNPIIQGYDSLAWWRRLKVTVFQNTPRPEIENVLHAKKYVFKKKHAAGLTGSIRMVPGGPGTPSAPGIPGRPAGP